MATSSASSVPPASTGSVITVASPSTGGSTISGGTGSPCAACKFLRRKCQPDCVFAPYFPPDNPQKFVHVHRVFGASNVTKILNELHPYQREDAVNSLAYEADMRLRDPVYGCVGVISILQHRLRQVQQELARASYELSKYQAAAAEATAASVAVGCNGAAAGMAADFVGNPVPNCTQNFINVGHSAAASIGGAGFVQHDHFASMQMLAARSYDGEAATTAIARLGMNGGGGGGYGFGYSSGIGAGHGVVSGLGQISSGQFLKPGTAGGDEQPTAAQ
ncbi:LOB domain-containing protein 6 [Dichanthelium oligosanthes]|uniref:LOB domain-containing protein 6 n=1 Tax=Dichanthelium oligosanthes TaxID=888268 RepID=A0A1E5V598_9POAL|nr:LOB domain-containing protein 6 [Dichanthelium oligosanthes]